LKILLNQKEITFSFDKHYTKEEKILTLVKNFENRGLVILGEMKSEEQAKVRINLVLSGMLLSSSGTEGKRAWVLHPWENLINRIKSKKIPKHRCMIFLSLDHAAAVEGFFSHYLNDVDCGVFSPSLSVIEVLSHLKFHNPKSISTTPSSLLRFISYPEVRQWIKNNLEELTLGGESIPINLQKILKDEFGHIQLNSVFGTTETWSISTIPGEGINWHKLTDENVSIEIRENELYVNGPYLFSHHWDGEKFTARKEGHWRTGDKVDCKETNHFRLIDRSFLKYRGLKIFPHEWEDLLKAEFNLEWAQATPVYELDNLLYFSMNLPQSVSSKVADLRKLARDNSWSILNWNFLEGPVITARGKQDHSGWQKISRNELVDLYSQVSKANYEYTYLEEYTWNDGAEFNFYQLDEGFLFYKINPCRLSLQYSFRELAKAESALKKLSDEIIIRLPENIYFDEGSFSNLGLYYVWELDLKTWRPAAGQSTHSYQRMENVSTQFDHLLKGKEKKILSTLSDSNIYHLKENKKEALCAFGLVGDSYHGTYLFNEKFSIREFLQLYSLGLLEAKTKGLARAVVRVDDENVSAKFIHEALGFTKTKRSIRLWSNKIYE